MESKQESAKFPLGLLSFEINTSGFLKYNMQPALIAFQSPRKNTYEIHRLVCLCVFKATTLNSPLPCQVTRDRVISLPHLLKESLNPI